MGSPKEKFDEISKIQSTIWNFVNKFLEKKYKREFKFNGVEHDMELHRIKMSDYSINYIRFSLKGKFSSFVRFQKGAVDISVGGKLIYCSTGYPIPQSRSQLKYKNLIEYIKIPENTKKILDYATYINKFLWTTDYIYSLPLAYTFLLSNNKTKIFPRDIAKLITQKILFFIFKKLKKKNEKRKKEKRK